MFTILLLFAFKLHADAPVLITAYCGAILEAQITPAEMDRAKLIAGLDRVTGKLNERYQRLQNFGIESLPENVDPNDRFSSPIRISIRDVRAYPIQSSWEMQQVAEAALRIEEWKHGLNAILPGKIFSGGIFRGEEKIRKYLDDLKTISRRNEETLTAAIDRILPYAAPKRVLGNLAVGLGPPAVTAWAALAFTHSAVHHQLSPFGGTTSMGVGLAAAAVSALTLRVPLHYLRGFFSREQRALYRSESGSRRSNADQDIIARFNEPTLRPREFIYRSFSVVLSETEALDLQKAAEEHRAPAEELLLHLDTKTPTTIQERINGPKFYDFIRDLIYCVDDDGEPVLISLLLIKEELGDTNVRRRRMTEREERAGFGGLNPVATRSGI